MWHPIIEMVNKMEEDYDKLGEMDEVTAKAMELVLLMVVALREVAIKEERKRLLKEKAREITNVIFMCIAFILVVIGAATLIDLIAGMVM